jgi:hypothetical protein
MVGLLIVSATVLLVILLRPRRDPYVRRITSSRNGLPWWRDRELY